MGLEQYFFNNGTSNPKNLNSTEIIMTHCFWIICDLFLDGIPNSVVLLSLFMQVCVETVAFMLEYSLFGPILFCFMLLKQ